MIKSYLSGLIKKAYGLLTGKETEDVFLTSSGNQQFGDYTSSLPLKVYKTFNQSPMGVARKLAEKIINLDKADKRVFKVIEPIEPGFINFFIDETVLLKDLAEKLKEKTPFEIESKPLKGKKIMIEFAHPNTHKQFHIGHLRNISLGEALVRLHESLGATVIRANYQGDVGLHVAKALWGIMNSSKFKNQSAKLDNESILERIKFLGECYVEGNKAYEEDKKEEVVAINKKIYAKDPEVLLLWEKTRAWSLEYFDRIYKRLGTHYDRLFFESEVADSGTRIAEEALDKGILTKSEGAVIFDGTLHGTDKRVFLNSEGLPTYEAKELGLAALEFSEFGLIDRLIHVVGPEQQSFFKATFKVEELLDSKKYGGRQFHFVYGYVRLKEGKMSSRKGNVVTAISVIDQAESEIGKLIKREGLVESEIGEITEKVAMGAVKYSMLRSDAKNDITFDLKESVALEGNSGPYLQYTYARAKSVLSKSVEAFSVQGLEHRYSADHLYAIRYTLVAEEISLLRTLYKFPEVVETAALRYEPHLLCNFLFDLAQKFNLFYNNIPILSNDSDVLIRSRRLVLTKASALIIKNGLYLLGIETPERM